MEYILAGIAFSDFLSPDSLPEYLYLGKSNMQKPRRSSAAADPPIAMLMNWECFSLKSMT